MYVNCTVWGNPQADALAVGPTGRFLWVGALPHIGAAAGAEVVDLGGQLVIPGLVDAHVHLINGGLSLSRLDLRGIKSKEEFIERVCTAAGEPRSMYSRAFAAERKPLVASTPGAPASPPHTHHEETLVASLNPCQLCFCACSWTGKLQPGAWLLGGNWDESGWGGEPPSATWVDGCTPHTPLFLHRMDAHMGLCNSKALILAGIGRETPDPEGGVIVRWVLGLCPVAEPDASQCVRTGVSFLARGWGAWPNLFKVMFKF